MGDNMSHGEPGGTQQIRSGSTTKPADTLMEMLLPTGWREVTTTVEIQSVCTEIPAPSAGVVSAALTAGG